MKWLFGTTGFVLWAILTSIARGYALSKLWLWFVVSRFAVPSLSIANGIGIALVVSMLTHRNLTTPKPPESESKEDRVTRMITAFLMPFFWSGFFLFEGWIVKQWLP